MASVAEIFDAMADLLIDTYENADLGNLAIQVESRMVNNPTALTVDIYPGDPFSESTGAGFGGITGIFTATVRARTNTPDDFEAQGLLLDLMDDEHELSVAAALHGETLGDIVTSLKVDGWSGYVRYIDEGGQGAYLGCEWRFRFLKAYS